MKRRHVIAVSTLVGVLAGATGATAAWKASTSTTSQVSAAAEFPPLTVTVPTVIGSAQDGQTLKLDLGSYNPPATSATYEWLRCDSVGASCASIGTSATQLLAAADVNKTIRVRVTPKNGSTTGPVATSDPTMPANGFLSLAPVLNLSVLSPLPGITGTAAVGQTLTASDGIWIALLAVGSRQWLRCDELGAGCTAIAGATGQTYVPVAADRDKRLRLRMTGTGALGTSNVSLSLATAKVT